MAEPDPKPNPKPNPWCAVPGMDGQPPAAEDFDDRMVEALVRIGIGSGCGPGRHISNLLHAASLVLGSIGLRQLDDTEWERMCAAAARTLRKSARIYRERNLAKLEPAP